MLVKIDKNGTYTILDEPTYEVWPAVPPSGPTIALPMVTVTCTPQEDCFEITVLSRDPIYRILSYSQVFPNSTVTVSTPIAEASIASDTDYIIMNVSEKGGVR